MLLEIGGWQKVLAIKSFCRECSRLLRASGQSRCDNSNVEVSWRDFQEITATDDGTLAVEIIGQIDLTKASTI